ncbi:hypothetical protein LTR59_009053 [Friedmanniomyces endolithicus]|nr:hypothetical protein LTR94_012962 [Friedmanniomyces endolithicus]KAK0790973.1 hypothetical protein LTR59_009053 [Friedmanniomyces endolithicus]KAK0797163.1 hypothetical protein LTR38_008299 [Friedmanniomyces endolithicus]
MSSALQHAFRNSPKDKPKPRWLHHLLDSLGESVPGGDADKVNGHEVPPAVVNVKGKTGEIRVTKNDAQPQVPPTRQGQDVVQPLPKKHLEPRDARVLPDEEQERHHHATMDSIPMFGHRAKLLDSELSNGHTNGQASTTSESETPSKFEALREQIAGSVSQLKTVLKAIRDPLPTDTGDGSQLPPEKESTKAILDDIFKDLPKLGPDNIANLITVATAAATHGVLNDRDYRMERLIQAAALLPPDKVDEKLTTGFVSQLWNDLSHPPQTLLSDDYQYRQPDGSKNNYQSPHLGASGMPYARTVPRKQKLPGCLPDPGILFDATMARKNPKGEPHPNKISSMLFYLASVIIHDIFKTDHSNFNISATSSYLDLGPLYGNNWDEQKRMRTFEDGKIRPDCFSEPRLLTFPAGVGALLIMFNRYHNHVVEQLAAINEGGRFSEDPRNINVQRYGEEINKRDDDLFQTGRLITCGLYVNMILIDYVRTILNLNRTDENWQLNPRVDIPGGPAMGTGNQVSAEFNLVYRWHSAVSEKDDKWSQQLFKEIVPGISAAEAAQPDKIRSFLMVLAKKETDFTSKAPPDRPWPALKEDVLDRIKDGPLEGTFKDDDLAKIVTDSIEDCANAYGPQQVPTVMKAIEILGIQQARTWQVATLNEFREHFGLKPYRKFEEITDNREVSDALKHLYDTPDNVELYPGLVIEDAKRPFTPGSGLCPGFTVSRGVLSDAVALVRGDRFFTTNYTPASLTNWGYQECSSDVNIDNGRALPNNYDPASVYAHYPMTVPHGTDGMAEVLKKLGKAHRYTDLVDGPAPRSQRTVIYSYDAVAKVLKDTDRFIIAPSKAVEDLVGIASSASAKNVSSQKLIQDALYPDKWQEAVRTYFEKTTTQLLQQKSYTLAGTRYVDIIRDVGNLVPIHFVSEIFSLPLKTEAFPRGILTEQQLYTVFAAIATAASSTDLQQTFPLRQQASDTTHLLRDFVKGLLHVVKVGGDLAEWIGQKIDPIAPELKAYGVPMLRRLAEAAAAAQVSDGLVTEILSTAGVLAATRSQLFAQAIDFFISTPEGQKVWPKLKLLAQSPDSTPDTDQKLVRYILEACRLTGGTGTALRTVHIEASSVKTFDLTDTPAGLGARTHTLKSGDELLLNLRAASRDPTAFPDPDTFSPDRPIETYGPLFPHAVLVPLTRVILTSMLRAVARLEGLKAAPVAVGGKTVPSRVWKTVGEEFTAKGERVPEEWVGGRFLTEDWDMFFPFATSEFPVPRLTKGT